MADDRPFPKDDDLPEWLRGHIHQPDEDEGETPPSTDESPPWSPEAADEAELPSAGELRGMTGSLPWMSDVKRGETPEEGDEAAAAWSPDDAAPEPPPPIKPLPDSAAEQPPAAQQEAEAATPDWLSGMDDDDLTFPDDDMFPPEEEGASAAVPPGPTAPAEVPSLADPDAPVADWLSQAPPPPSASASEEEEPLPDFDDLFAAEDFAPPPAEAEAEALPDWLGAVGEGFAEEEAAQSGAVPPAEDEPDAGALPDWLQAADELAAEPMAPEAPTGPPPGEELPSDEVTPGEEAVPDWLSEAELLPEEESPASPPSAEAPPADESLPDWLSDSEPLFEAGAEAEAVPGPPPPVLDPDEPPEWLITDTGEFPMMDLPDEPGEDEGTYEDWLREQEAAELPPPSPEDELAAEVPDWFADLGGDEAAEVPPAAPEPGEPAVPAEPGAPEPTPESAEFVPDWYLGLEEQDADSAPEWFRDLDYSTGALTAQPEEPPEEPAEEEDLFDFVQEFGTSDLLPPEEPSEAPPAPESPLAPLAEDEVPDWFREMTGDEPAVPEPEPPVPPASADEGDLFDFDLGTGDLVLPDDLPAPAEEEAPPDWFAEMEAPAPESPSPEPEAAPAPADDLAPAEPPDWLSELAPGEEPPPISEPLSTDALFDEDEDFMALIEGELGAEALAGLEEAPGDLTPPPGRAADLAALLEAAEEEVPAAPEAEAPAAAAGDIAAPAGIDAAELPDWLQQARVDDTQGFSAVDQALRGGEEIPPEQLSERLQALRARTAQAAAVEPEPAPPDAGAPSEVLSEIAAPLSPARIFEEPGAPEVAGLLTLDEVQQSRVDRLRSLLGLDAVPEPVDYDEAGRPIYPDAQEEAQRFRQEVRRREAASRRKPDRIIISLLLLAALVLPFFVDFSGIFEAPPPALDTALHGELDAAIEALDPGALVLVGFEYGPTAAGEMDALAETLLMHILLQGARPVVVSTNPAGTLHARDVLADLAADEFLLAHLGRAPDDPLTTPAHYVVLPYLPGGAVGLRSLTATSTDADALDRGVFSVDLEGNPTGLNIRLLQISFELVLTLAERGEDVRLWVEQVGVPVGVPLAAGVAVAAEPVARPYLDSGQLVGLLAGYRDAYIYDHVLLASLQPLLPAPPLAAGDGVDAVVIGDSGYITPTTSGRTAADGLTTLTPAPSATPTITLTPSATATPTFTFTPSATTPPDEATAAAVAIASGTLPPTETPSITPSPTIITATPQPEAGAVAQLPTPPPDALQPDRAYQDERWYSISLGAVIAGVVIALGALINIGRSIRRRQQP